MDDSKDRGPDAARKVAASKLFSQLVKITIDRMKLMPGEWAKLGEQKQREIIDGVSGEFEAAVSTAVETIAAGNYPTIRCKVDSVLFKDGVKAVLTTDGTAAERHQLADAQGQSVAVVVVDVEKFLARTDHPQPARDQGALELGAAARH